MTAIPDDIRAELVSLHLQTSVLWLPWRARETPEAAAAAIHERRAHYHRFGLQTGSGGDAATRQQRSRFLRGMAHGGWIRLRGIGKAQGVRLTDRGYRTACAICPGPRPWEAFPLLRQVAELQDAGYCHAHGGYVLENHLLDSSAPTIGEMTGLEDRATPLIVLGYLESMSDTVGRLGYRLTAAGRRALQTPLVAPEAAPEYDAAIADSCIDRWVEMTRDRAKWLPIDSGDLVVALSAGLWSRGPEEVTCG